MTQSLSKRLIGTSVYGIRMPIISQGDAILDIICDTLIQATKSTYQPIKFDNRDIVGVTESFLARSEHNYVSLDDVAAEVSAAFPTGDVAVVFPICSRNRFAKILEGITRGVQGKVYVCLSYPTDEVGNPIMDEDILLQSDVNLYTDIFTAEAFKTKFGSFLHPFTQTDYIELYQSICDKIEIVMLNNPKDVLKFSQQVIIASIHNRIRHQKILQIAGTKVITLQDICSQPVAGRGWSEYGLLGANYSNNDMLKLFPRNAPEFCHLLQDKLYHLTGKKIEVMVYGDGGFKCPAQHIWEFADPVVSPGFTDGLKGTPNEVKIKAVADSYSGCSSDAVINAIAQKKAGQNNYNLGTTPRRITDLVGSLCDLTSGSGDKGTPVVYIKGYFDDYTTPAPQE